jgi:hypothetical protein
VSEHRPIPAKSVGQLQSRHHYHHDQNIPWSRHDMADKLLPLSKTTITIIALSVISRIGFNTRLNTKYICYDVIVL